MAFKNLLSIIVFGLLLCSCVPIKDLVYLQNKTQTNQAVVVKPIVLKPYRLQTNDVLNISIKAIDPKLVAIFNPIVDGQGAPQSEQGLYFSGFTVDDHGNIRFPVLGDINVLGFTLDETRLKIEQELLRVYFNKEANVFVTVKLSGLRFTINGEVGSPGTKILFQERVTILEAIANSGDINVVGDRKKVAVIRKFSHGTEIHEIDLTDSRAMESPYYFLQPNDYIYVKPLPQKVWGTGKTGIESLTTLISLLTLGITTFLLLRNQ